MSEDIKQHDVHSRIDRIEVTLNHAVEAIEKMAQVVNKPQDVKWGPILTAVGLLFVMGGGYTTLSTAPVRERAEVLEAQVLILQENELKRERAIGRIEGYLHIEVPDE